MAELTALRHMTDVQEISMRNLRSLTHTRNLYVCHTDLQQDFSRVSLSHQTERDLIHAHCLDISSLHKTSAFSRLVCKHTA